MPEKDSLRAGLLLCLVGPTGAGKSTFASRLLTMHSQTLSLSISATARAPRKGEIDGEAYNFVTREHFEELITAGEFFEWEEIHGNLYGTYSRSVTEAIESGMDLLLEIDIKGALNFKEKFPHHTVIVFLIPPSAAELRKRVENRGAVTEEEIARRLKTAQCEYAALRRSIDDPGKVDYFVVNEEREETLAVLNAILVAERCKFLRVREEVLTQLCRIS